MPRLSVNVNKIATLRNARGGNIPDVQKAAKECERSGAEGITVHPRPDERHIKYADVRELKELLSVEFNVEGYPSYPFLELMKEVIPDQVTLVPDPPEALTSNAGWDTVEKKKFLKRVVGELQDLGCRVSLFMETDPEMIRAAAETGTDRIELYTEAYAQGYEMDRVRAISPYIHAAEVANEGGLGVNAGHDLDLSNLGYFCERVPHLLEVSIGHALIADALYYGLEETIRLYLEKVKGIAEGISHHG